MHEMNIAIEQRGTILVTGSIKVNTSGNNDRVIKIPMNPIFCDMFLIFQIFYKKQPQQS